MNRLSANQAKSCTLSCTKRIVLNELLEGGNALLGLPVRRSGIDRLRAMVEPAMDSGDARRHSSFHALEQEIADLVSEPHGSGLDVPDWLSALEDEVTEARSKLNHVSSSDRLSRRIGQVRLSWDEILEQLGE